MNVTKAFEFDDNVVIIVAHVKNVKYFNLLITVSVNTNIN